MADGARKRNCGRCRACCEVLGVEEIGKPEYARCPSQVGNPRTPRGCVDYQSRPEGCRTYECYWLQAGMPRDARPDRCGVILDTTGEFTARWGPRAVQAREVSEGAGRRGRGKRLLDALFDAGFLVVLSGRGGFRRATTRDPMLAARIRGLLTAGRPRGRTHEPREPRG